MSATSKPGPRIHPTAVVHPEAEVHYDNEIGPYSIVGPKVKMGPGNIVKSHVVLQNRTTIGEGNIFHPFSVIGTEPQDLKYKGEDTELVIGNRNVIRECVTLNIGTVGGGGVTKIGDGNLIMAYSHLGHDVIMGNSIVISNSCQIAGHVTIDDFAILGGMTAVSQFIRVGAHTYIGGCSGLDRDLPPFTLGRGIASEFEVRGMNLVGLKRRGFSSDEILALQEVNNIFFKDKSLEKEMALRKIENELSGKPIVDRFVQFCRGSEKGIYR